MVAKNNLFIAPALFYSSLCITFAIVKRYAMTQLKVILVTLLCPPLMVVGYGMKRFLVVLLLTFLGWLPGVIASFIVQAGPIPEDTI